MAARDLPAPLKQKSSLLGDVIENNFLCKTQKLQLRNKNKGFTESENSFYSI